MPGGTWGPPGVPPGGLPEGPPVPNVGDPGRAALSAGQGLTLMPGETLEGLQERAPPQREGTARRVCAQRPLTWGRPDDTGRASGEASWAGSTKDSRGAWLLGEYRDSTWTAGPDRCRGASRRSQCSEPGGSPLGLQEGPWAKASPLQLLGFSLGSHMHRGMCACVCPPLAPPCLPRPPGSYWYVVPISTLASSSAQETFIFDSGSRSC